MLVRGYARLIKDGNPVPDGTEVRIRLHEDNSLIATTTTVGGEFEHNFQGNPGPYYVTVDHAGEVHVSSSKVVGMSGPVNIGGIPLLFRLWRDGYIPGVLDELLISSDGVGMSVDANGGCGLVRGVLYDQSNVLPLTIEAADAQQRIDLVALQVVPAGADDNTEGRAQVIVKKGVPSSSPSAPALTQTSSLWEIPLANIVVDIGASSIASNKVVDRREQANVQIGDGYIDTVMLADGAVTTAKLDDKAVTAAKIADNTITATQIATDAVGSDELAANAVTSSHIANDAVTSAKIAAGAVTNSELATNSITDVKIVNGTITGGKLANDTITAGKIASGAVTSSELADNSVTGAKIVNGTITGTKLASNTITATQIAADAVGQSELAANSVTTGHIVNGTILESDLNSAVTAKLNTYGYNHQTMAPFDWINITSTSFITVANATLSLSAGTWALFCQYEGMVGTTTENKSAIQLRFIGTAVDGFVTSHAVQNYETYGLTGLSASLFRINPDTLASSGSRTLTLQARRGGSYNCKIQGVVNLYAIKVGP